MTITDCAACAAMPEGLGCLEHTCPDCGVVSTVVCGSPDDVSDGQACLARQGSLLQVQR